MSASQTIEDWLCTLEGIYATRRCTVKIQGTTYEAVDYLRDFPGIPSARNPAPYTQRIIYCVGTRPKKIGGICYTWAESKHEWFVCGYMPKENLTEENKHMNPCGVNFLLGPWDIPNSKIDTGMPPYKRVPMEVTYK